MSFGRVRGVCAAAHELELVPVLYVLVENVDGPLVCAEQWFLHAVHEETQLRYLALLSETLSEVVKYVQELSKVAKTVKLDLKSLLSSWSESTVSSFTFVSISYPYRTNAHGNLMFVQMVVLDPPSKRLSFNQPHSLPYIREMYICTHICLYVCL